MQYNEHPTNLHYSNWSFGFFLCPRGTEIQCQQDFFSNLLHNHPTQYTFDEIDYSFKGNNYYYAYYICIGTFCTYHYNQFAILGDLWNQSDFDNKLYSIIPEPDTLWIIHEEINNKCFLVYGSETNSIKKQKEFLSKLLLLVKEFPYPSTVIYGPATEKKENIKNIFIDLNNTDKNFSLFAHSLVLDINNITSQPALNILPFSEQKFLSDLLVEEKYELFHKQLDKCLDLCEKTKCPNRKLNSVLKRVCEIANNNYIPITITEQIDELMTNTYRYSDLRKGMHDMLNDIFQTIPENKKTNIVDLVKEYIENHYTEQFSLSVLADKHNLSISYLSNSYKKAYGKSPNDYIIELRMQRAKTLLKEHSDVSIRQISELIGYTDPYYFSRLFKVYAGMTPSQYRSNDD